VRRDEVVRGQVLAAPGSVHPHRTGTAELYLISAKEGGRVRPVRSGYRPQFYFGGSDVTGTLELEIDIAPGDHAAVRFALDRAIAFEPGVRFTLRESGRTIGAGVVLDLAT
jgi:elongation factor Tu